MDVVGYLIEEFKTNQFLSGGLVLTFLGGIVLYLKTPLMSLLNMLMRVVKYTVYFEETERFFTDFNKWLNSSRYNSKIRDVQLTTKTVNKERVIVLNQRQDNFLIWYRRRPLFLVKNQEKLENARDFMSLMHNSYKIIGFFSKPQIEALCAEVLNLSGVDRPKHGFDLYLSGDNGWVCCGEVIGRPYSSVILNNRVKEKFLKEINDFLASRQWYYDKGIPYRFGAMFEGPPGNGKTSFAKAVASESGMKLHYLNLSSHKMDDNTLMNMFFVLGGKTMVLVEDIDTLFAGRKSLMNNGVTFSGFLNAIDGVASKEGVVVVFTTNKASQLDPALTRNGRIDRVIRFDYPEAENINEYFRMFFGKELGLHRLKCEVSMAKVQDVCVTHKHDFAKASSELHSVADKGTVLPAHSTKAFPATGKGFTLDSEMKLDVSQVGG